MLAERERRLASPPAMTTPPQSEKPPEAAPTTPDASEIEWPPETGKLVDLPRLSATELAELADVLVRHLRTEQGYGPVEAELAKTVPALPESVNDERFLALEREDGHRVLRFGYWSYRSRAPQLVIYGATVKGEKLTPNPDLALVEAVLEGALAALQEMREDVTPQHLESRIIQLSYIDTKGAMSAMKGLGLTTVEAGSDIPADIKFEQLPIVVELPAPASEATGLVGAKTQLAQGQFGSTVVPTIASDMESDVVASPTSRLLVLFHPAHPEQFSRVKRVLDEVIDRPARQIFVEAMIIEISSLGLKELGLEWEFRDGKFDVLLGSLSPDTSSSTDTLDVFGQKTQDLPTDWFARIRALITDGKAEILSRPSVLTLNNRQATIRIGQDIPIATSQEGLSADSSKISFDFKYLSLGILLNIRPRISQDASEVSLMVDIMVSSRIPGADLEIRDENGKLLASAPSVDSRRVQTYARVQNNTPFIIGGLVSRDKTTIYDKVPILGDIPLLKYLFRSESTREIRREVIIVLTPFIVPEELYLSRALPKRDLIDSSDLELFRDSRRIQMEDIVDVSFLYRNQRFQTYSDLAREAIRENFQLGETEPFRSFAERRLPAERILVDRILYNVLSRHGAEEAISSDRLAVLTAQGTGGYEVVFLENVLGFRNVEEGYESFFTDNPDKALALIFHDPYESEDGESLAGSPVPEMRIVDCADRKQWGQLLWELNQPEEDGRSRNTILLHGAEDLLRLRRAVMLKLTLLLNRGASEVSLYNFIPGRMIEIPNPRPGASHFLDARIARMFFHSMHFYAAAIQEIEKNLLELDRELRRPEMLHLLDGKDLPPLAERK